MLGVADKDANVNVQACPADPSLSLLQQVIVDLMARNLIGLEDLDPGTAFIIQHSVFPYRRYSGYKPIGTSQLDKACDSTHVQHSSTSSPDLEHACSRQAIVASLGDTDDHADLQGLLLVHGEKEQAHIPNEGGQNKEEFVGVGTQFDADTELNHEDSDWGKCEEPQDENCVLVTT